jgi:arylsulfatase
MALEMMRFRFEITVGETNVTRPNILFLLPDQLRGDWIGAAQSYYPVDTPNIDQLAATGLRCSKTWTPSPICAAARACIATGQNYDRSLVKHNNENLPLDADTFYRRIRDNGYCVVSTGKVDLLKGEMDWGQDGQHIVDGQNQLHELGFSGGIDSAGKHDALRGRERGKQEPYFHYLTGLGLDKVHADDYAGREPAEFRQTIAQASASKLAPPPAYANTDLSPLPEVAYNDNWVGALACEHLQGLCAQPKPWFLTVNFSGPHEPLDVTADMRKGWEDVEFPAPYGRHCDDAELQQRIRQNYAAMIQLIDDWVGKLLEILRETGAIDTTIIAFASDHGEMLGDYDMWGKSVPFEPSLHVPLIINGPMVNSAGRTVTSPVSLLDVAATFLDYADCQVPLNDDGISLRPAIEQAAPHARKYGYSGLGNWRAVTNGRFKLVAGYRTDVVLSDTQFEIFDEASIETAKLFDQVNDPWDSTDVSHLHPDIMDRLKSAMKQESQKPVFTKLDDNIIKHERTPSC